jgi:hypothetical protein
MRDSPLSLRRILLYFIASAISVKENTLQTKEGRSSVLL